MTEEDDEESESEEGGFYRVVVFNIYILPFFITITNYNLYSFLLTLSSSQIYIKKILARGGPKTSSNRSTISIICVHL